MYQHLPRECVMRSRAGASAGICPATSHQQPILARQLVFSSQPGQQHSQGLCVSCSMMHIQTVACDHSDASAVPCVEKDAFECAAGNFARSKSISHSHKYEPASQSISQQGSLMFCLFARSENHVKMRLLEPRIISCHGDLTCHCLLDQSLVFAHHENIRGQQRTV